MADLATTQTFADGDSVTAAKMNNIVGNAALLPDAITAKSEKAAVSGATDYVLIYDGAQSNLKKASVSNIRNASSDVSIAGNQSIGGTLGVTGNVSVNTNKFNVTAASGNTSIAGTLGVAGDVAINTNKLNIAATSGNTSIAGTLGVADTISATKATGTGLSVTNNATIGGTLGVTGAITATSAINGTTIPTSKTLVTTVDAQTLTSKTLTSPVISSISNSGTITLPTSTDTLVGRATTDTLTNKTLTLPIISQIVNVGTISLPTATDTLVGRTTTDTLTNKTLSSPTISGGSINGTPIGAGTPSTGAFSTISASGLITASGGVSGNVTGNCTGTAGSISGFNNPTTAATANTIAYRDSSGDLSTRYFFGTYYNQSSANGENPPVSQIAVTNGGDNYWRKASIAHLTNSVQANASGTWGINISGNASNISSYSINQSLATSSNPTFGTIYTSNWFRSYGATGWYNQDYGGGIHMQDSTYIRTYGSKQFYVDSHILAGGNVTAYSDERLKTDWNPLAPDIINKLSEVRAGTYLRTDSKIKQVGVSAQSLQKVMPEAVIEGENGYLTVSYGNAALVACVELSREVVALRKEVSELRSKIKD